MGPQPPPGPYFPPVQHRPDEIRRLEALADRAWPPAEVVPCDGWELRATGPGIGRRVNSVATAADGSLPLDERISGPSTSTAGAGFPQPSS